MWNTNLIATGSGISSGICEPDCRNHRACKGQGQGKRKEIKRKEERRGKRRQEEP